MNCCEFHKLDCDQGDFCPLRSACLANRATPLNTDNSDGSSAGHAADELLDDTGLLICQGIALAMFSVSLVLSVVFALG